jgi:hypothetical protein
MRLTFRQGHTFSGAYDPLREAGILKHVFAFLPGNWILLGAVCREWKSLYAGMPNRQLRRLRTDDYNKPVTCGSTSTIYTATVASPATVKLAVRTVCK